MGKELVFRGQPRPHPKGAGSQRSPIFGDSLLFLRAPFDAELYTKFNTVTHVGRGVYTCHWVSHVRLPSQESRVPALPTFGGSPVFMPTERRNSAW